MISFAMSPAQAIVWQFWRRNRWGFALSAAYLIAAASVIQLLPASVLAAAFYGDDVSIAGRCLGLPCALLLVYVISVFARFAEEGLKDSEFSSRTFVLPLDTRTLVACPLVAGCLTLAVAWLAIALFILRPAGIPAPFAWPIVALAFFLAVLQLVAWVPLAQLWLRGFFMIAALIFVAASVVGLALSGLPEPAIAAVLAALVLPTYAAAVYAVTLARRGDAYDWRAWRRLLERLAEWHKPGEHPFASADQAQLWFELRAHGWVLPLTLGSMVLLITPLLVVAERFDIAAGWRFLALLLAMPALLAVAMGGQLGKQDPWSRYAMSPLLTAKPIATTRLIRAKLLMCLVSTIVGFALMLPAACLMFTRPGFGAHVIELAHTVGMGKSIAIVAIAVASLIAVTWLQVAANLWISLTGRKWFVNALMYTFSAMVGIGTLAGVWIYFHEELHVYLLAAVPWILPVLLGAKLIAAALVLGGLVRTRLISSAMAIGMTGLWCLVAGGLWLTLWLLAPAESVPLGTLATGIALALPFSRLAGAPLALHWNRHR